MAFYEVVKVGVHLFGITNGMTLNGRVPLNVEFANPDTNGTLTQLFLVDGNDVDGTNGNYSGSSFPQLAGLFTNRLSGVWDTTQVTNGSYSLQLGAILDDGTVYLDHPVTVTVSNLAWLPDPWNVAGQAIYVGVQTPYTDGSGTWRLDAYDDQNNHLGFITGVISANGYLNVPGFGSEGFSINNTDGSGNQNPSASYQFTYQADAAHPLNATPPYTFTNYYAVELPWNFAPTYSTICYMDVFGNSRPIAQQEALAMMQTVSAIESVYHPLVSGIGDTLNVYQVGQNGTWSNLVVSGLRDPSSRDFIYFGHGSSTALGVTGTSVTNSDIAYQLQNNDLVNNNPLQGPNYHAYRFVFLDGCLTAEGNWPQAFGIPKQTGMQITDFTNKRGIRPRAFMGWNRKKDIGWTDGGLMNNDHIVYITTFWQNWAASDTNGKPFTLQGAIRAAGTETDPISGNTFPNPQRFGMVLYGAQDLTILQ